MRLMEVAMSAVSRGAITALSGAAVAGSLVATPMAAAQDTNVRLLLSLEDTRRCICADAEIEQLRAEAQSDPLQQEFDRLDKIVENARPNVDTTDEAEVDSFRRLYNQREELRLQLNARPYISRLNSIVGAYNAQCASASMLKVNVDAVNADPTACMNPQ
jgi:vacuolar-type H+-ATPase subunit I/STV1